MENNTLLLEGKKILVVDDSVLNRLIATTILKKKGVLLMEAENGVKAIELMRKNTFDLVLMDIQMPELNGYDAATKARNELKLSTPIIALTGNATEGEKEKCVETGMSDYLPKPFSKDQLLEIVCNWISK